jgi:hypothetical protein
LPDQGWEIEGEQTEVKSLELDGLFACFGVIANAGNAIEHVEKSFARR